MARHDDAVRRMENRIGELIKDFARYVEVFEERDLFTGPSRYFHLQTIQRLHAFPSPSEAIQDDGFLESLYATLTAWGMHRMGQGDTKLREFHEFKASFVSQLEPIRCLERVKLKEASEGQVPTLTNDVWKIISDLQIGTAETKIVIGSKTLHHVLPDLVPPIDRQYTLNFFYGHKTLNLGDEKPFREIFPQFHRIATACSSKIGSFLSPQWNSRTQMNTSTMKIVDNAIVGYVLSHKASSSGLTQGE